MNKPGEQTDDELITAALAGSTGALDTLLRRHYSTIQVVCFRIAGNARDGEDATQEALIRIVHNLESFAGRAEFSTWAYRIATNAAIDELRKRQRRPQLHRLDDTERPAPVDDAAARAIDSLAERDLLQSALANLDETFRITIILRDVAQLEYGEIASQLDIPIGTVKSRLARGRKQLLHEVRRQTENFGNQPPGVPRRTLDPPHDS